MKYCTLPCENHIFYNTDFTSITRGQSGPKSSKGHQYMLKVVIVEMEQV